MHPQILLRGRARAQAHERSSFWRKTLLGTVAASAICVAMPNQSAAGPDACTIVANVATCTGNQANGISSGTDFNAPPVDTLNVNNLSGNIAPAAGVSGIVFTLGAADLGAINIISNTGNVSIVTTGAADGISAVAGVAPISIDHTGNISTQNGAGIAASTTTNNADAGSVTVGMTGNIGGTDGIRAQTFASGTANAGASSVFFSGAMNVGGTGIDTQTTAGTGNAGAATVESDGNIIAGATAIQAGSTALNGNAGTVTVSSEGTLSGNLGIFAQSLVAGSGDAGLVDVSSSGAISSTGAGIDALSRVGGLGDAGAVSVTNSGNITAGGTNSVISALSLAETDGDSGAVTVESTGNLTGGITGIRALAFASGAGAAGNVFIGSAGNIISGSGISAESTAQGTGNANTVEITSIGNITASDGPAIDALSSAVGGDSGAVTIQSTGNLTSATAQNGISARSISTAGDAGNIFVSVDGNITAGADGIRAASLAAGTAGDIEIAVSGIVRGGTGAGVRFDGGANNLLTIGSNASVLSLSGTAISSTGLSDDIVNNSGTVTGNVQLGAGSNLFTNFTGATFNAGSIVDLGPLGLLDNSGTLAPGGNGTTLTSALTGHLILQTGGTFAVDVSAAGADRLNASGTATLGGRVLPIVTGLISGTQQFTILTAAGGVLDDGITVTDTAVFDFELVLGANDMVLEVTADFTPANADLTPNQNAVGEHIQNALAAGAGALGDLITYLGTIVDPAALAAAFDRLHPEPYLAQVKSTLFANLGFTDSMLSCPVSQGPNVAATLVEGQCAWARLGGRALEVDRTRENIGFTDKSWGGSAGVQFALAPNWLGSVALGYDRSDIKVDDRATATGDIFQIGAGAKYTMGAWQFSGTVTGGLAQYDTTRFAVMPGVDASGEASMNFVAGRLRAAHVFGTEASYIKPLVDLDAIVFRRDGILETGAGPAGLDVKGQTDAFFSIAPAIEFGGQFAYASGTLLRPFLRAGVRLFSDDELSASATFIGTPGGVPAFTATTPLGQWMGEVSAGLEILSSDRYARISYDGRFAERTTQHGGNIKLRARF